MREGPRLELDTVGRTNCGWHQSCLLLDRWVCRLANLMMKSDASFAGL